MPATADLSVIMPTYNHAQFLPRALTALLSQSVRPAEVIVVNDNSPDETPAILDEFARNDPVLKVIHNDLNVGVNESVCRGVAQATCKYLFFASSDDYVLPGFVEKTIGQLERHTNAGLCCSYQSTFDAITEQVFENPSHWCESPHYFTSEEAVSLPKHRTIAGHTSIMKRSSFDAAGGMRAELEWHSDLFLLLVIAYRDGFCHIPETLSLWRVAPESYFMRGHRTAKQRQVLNALIDLLNSPMYADVRPAFERSGVLSVLGTGLLSAAAARDDTWSIEMLRLLNSFTYDEYTALLDDGNPAERELATFFLGAFWREAKQRRIQELEDRHRLELALSASDAQLAATRVQLTEREQVLAQAHRDAAEWKEALAQMRRLVHERDVDVHRLELLSAHLAQTIDRMKSSYFWKVRSVLAGCKRGLLHTLHRDGHPAAGA